MHLADPLRGAIAFPQTSCRYEGEGGKGKKSVGNSREGKGERKDVRGLGENLGEGRDWKRKGT